MNKDNNKVILKSVKFHSQNEDEVKDILKDKHSISRCKTIPVNSSEKENEIKTPDLPALHKRSLQTSVHVRNMAIKNELSCQSVKPSKHPLIVHSGEIIRNPTRSPTAVSSNRHRPPTAASSNRHANVSNMAAARFRSHSATVIQQGRYSSGRKQASPMLIHNQKQHSHGQSCNPQVLETYYTIKARNTVYDAVKLYKGKRLSSIYTNCIGDMKESMKKQIQGIERNPLTNTGAHDENTGANDESERLFKKYKILTRQKQRLSSKPENLTKIFKDIIIREAYQAKVGIFSSHGSYQVKSGLTSTHGSYQVKGDVTSSHEPNHGNATKAIIPKEAVDYTETRKVKTGKQVWNEFPPPKIEKSLTDAEAKKDESHFETTRKGQRDDKMNNHSFITARRGSNRTEVIGQVRQRKISATSCPKRKDELRKRNSLETMNIGDIKVDQQINIHGDEVDIRGNNTGAASQNSQLLLRPINSWTETQGLKDEPDCEKLSEEHISQEINSASHGTAETENETMETNNLEAGSEAFSLSVPNIKQCINKQDGKDINSLRKKVVQISSASYFRFELSEQLGNDLDFLNSHGYHTSDK